MKSIYLKENIRLRELQLSDAPELFRIIDTQRDYLGEWLPFVAHTKAIEGSQKFIRSIISVPQEEREFVFAILVEEQFAGIIGFKDTDRTNRKTEIGYWIGNDFQGRGIVTMATNALCRFAFQELNINRIQIKCAVGNIKSSSIPRKLGFVFEGIERDGELQSSGIFSDIEIFSLLRSEYEQ